MQDVQIEHAIEIFVSLVSYQQLYSIDTIYVTQKHAYYYGK